jgi:predicted SnoaL-like aldol condensation-catalyzing enzyme
MHPEAVAHGLGPESLHGPAGFKPFFHAFKGAFSNIRIHIERAVTQGDVVAVLCHVTANHAGDAFGPATRRDVDFWGTSIIRVRDDQIVEGWNTFDFLTMYQQMGWVANPVTQRA